jgi:hypothetical protein
LNNYCYFTVQYILYRMKLLIITVPLIFFFETLAAQFVYVAPVPGSAYHHANRTIILKTADPLNASSISNEHWYTVIGEKSGLHFMKTKLTDGNKTILLKPVQPFTPGEMVTVSIDDNSLRTVLNSFIEGFTFSFRIQPNYSVEEIKLLKFAHQDLISANFGMVRNIPQEVRSSDDFPRFVIDTNTNPAPGDIFYYSFNFEGEPTNHICIMSSDGDSVYSKKTTEKGGTFNINKNGYLTLFNSDSSFFEVWDSTYNIIDKYATQGYTTDAHEFILLPNGHSFLMAYDPQIVDMTIYNPNYKENATVVGAILQELDADKNLVFEWRSWDHIEITEAQHTYFWGEYIDYVHLNSIELDYDSNLLVSCRKLDQILKISRTTGEVMWRMGGEKNEFAFLNDPLQFNYQHDCRRLPNGHITIFDNGCYHSPPVASFKEYEVDEVNKTANLVFSYSHPLINGANLQSWAMGNAQRLDNGNTFINWGYIPPGSGAPNMTEIDSNGNIVWEMHFTDSNFLVVYRAHRYEWNPCVPTEIDSINAMVISEVAAIISWSPVRDAGSYLIQYQTVGAIDWDSLLLPPTSTFLLLKDLVPATTYNWRIQALCHAKGDAFAATGEQNFTTMSIPADTAAIGIEMVVFPNPASDQLNCIINGSGIADAQIMLIDVLGKEWYHVELETMEAGKSFAIPVTGLPRGLYILKMSYGNHQQLFNVILN